MRFKEIEKAINKYRYFPKYSPWIFIVLFFSISVIYNYQHILFYPPQSLHQWRQCDCLSITLNYYQNNAPFFEPAVNNLGWDGTGKTVSDFPLVYFIVGKLWKIFGQQESIYRMIVLLFFFSGLFALFKIFEDRLKDSVLALTGSLLMFTSPTLVYYANNFLMNIPALSLAMIGLLFFFRFVQTSSNKHLLLFCLFYSLAGLLKISSLLSFMAILGLFALELLGIKPIRDRKIFNRPIQQSLFLLGVLVIQMAWILFAVQYNKQNNAGYFLVGIIPLLGIFFGRDPIDFQRNP